MVSQASSAASKKTSQDGAVSPQSDGQETDASNSSSVCLMKRKRQARRGRRASRAVFQLLLEEFQGRQIARAQPLRFHVQNLHQVTSVQQPQRRIAIATYKMAFMRRPAQSSRRASRNALRHVAPRAPSRHCRRVCHDPCRADAARRAASGSGFRSLWNARCSAPGCRARSTEIAISPRKPSRSCRTETTARRWDKAACEIRDSDAASSASPVISTSKARPPVTSACSARANSRNCAAWQPAAVE